MWCIWILNQHNWKINKKHLVWSKHLLVDLLVNFELLETLLWNAFKGWKTLGDSGIWCPRFCWEHPIVHPLVGNWGTFMKNPSGAMSNPSQVLFANMLYRTAEGCPMNIASFRGGTHSMVFPHTLKPAGSWDLEADRTRFILPVAYNFYRHGPFFWAMIKLHGAHHGAHHGLWWSHHQWFHNKTLATWLRNNNERSTNGASWKSPTAQSRRRAQSCRILVFTEFNTYTYIYSYIYIFIYIYIELYIYI